MAAFHAHHGRKIVFFHCLLQLMELATSIIFKGFLFTQAYKVSISLLAN